MERTLLINSLSEEGQELICHDRVNLELLTLPDQLEKVYY